METGPWVETAALPLFKLGKGGEITIMVKKGKFQLREGKKKPAILSTKGPDEKTAPFPFQTKLGIGQEFTETGGCKRRLSGWGPARKGRWGDIVRNIGGERRKAT